jgi:hypothetical protein
MKRITLVPFLIIMLTVIVWAAGQQMGGRTNNWYASKTVTFSSGANDSVYLEHADCRNYASVAYYIYVSQEAIDSVKFSIQSSAYDDSTHEKWAELGISRVVSATGAYTLSAGMLDGAEDQSGGALPDSIESTDSKGSVYPLHNYSRLKARSWGAGTWTVTALVKQVKY